MDNQISLCLQTDVRSARPGRRAADAVLLQAGRGHPLPPLQRMLTATTQTEPLHQARTLSGSQATVQFPASTHKEAGIPTFFTWQNGSIS